MINFDQLNQAINLKLPGNQPVTLGNILSVAIPYLFGIAGFLLLLYLIWGGFSYMLSQGDPKAAESAKQKITNAVIGFVIIFAAYWLVQLLGMVLGIGQFGEVFR